MRRLSPQQMAEIALAALANARRLLADATFLRDAGRTPSAYVLAGLAADELGKHVLVASFFGRDDTEAEWRKFWTRLRRHQEKLGDALIGAWLDDPLAGQPPPDVERIHQLRLSATYVDIASDGTVAVPDETIGTEDLDDLLNQVRSEMEVCERVIRGASPAQLASTFADIRNSQLALEFRQAQQRSPTGPMALALAMRSGLDPSAALEFVAAVEDLVSGDLRSPGVGEEKQANE